MQPDEGHHQQAQKEIGHRGIGQQIVADTEKNEAGGRKEEKKTEGQVELSLQPGLRSVFETRAGFSVHMSFILF